MATLCFFSLTFYSYGEPIYLALILASIVFNFYYARILAAQPDKQNGLKYLSLGVAINLIPLIIFKYANFLVQTSVDFFGLPISLAHDMPEIPVPLGISFFTFQAIAYLIDVHRRVAVHEESMLRFGVYLSMFPQLVAGPIVRFQTISHQIHNHRIRLSLIVLGIKIFVLGLAQKILIADVLAVGADFSFDQPVDTLSTALAWFGIALYTMQIYFDFAGYSNMAIGLGLMLGFKLPKNFNHPYISQSITEFWRRWHITLSSWFRDYLYIPLGGNRSGTVRTLFNLVTVFILCGLWHGAALTFLVWGLWHGTFLVIERLARPKMPPMANPIKHAYTLLIVMIGWVFFRAENLAHAQYFLERMFWVSQPEVIAPAIVDIANNRMVFTAMVGVLMCIPVLSIARIVGRKSEERLDAKLNAVTRAYGTLSTMVQNILIVLLLTACMIEIMSGTYSPFIYFRF